MTDITTKYKTHTIEFNESLNRWYVTIKGRDYHRESLAELKQAIDRIGKAKFTPFEAIYYQGKPQRVRVTSFDGHAARATVLNAAGERESTSLIYPHYLYEINDTNNKAFAEIIELRKQASTIAEKIRDVESRLGGKVVAKRLHDWQKENGMVAG